MGLLRMVWVRPGVGIQFVTCGCQTVVAHCALYPQTGNTGINIRLLEQPWGQRCPTTARAPRAGFSHRIACS